MKLSLLPLLQATVVREALPALTTLKTLCRKYTIKAQKPPTAVVMLNMGGPATQEEVEGFLLNLFSDGDLIPLPWQSQLSKFITWRRTPMVRQQYAMIGGGSPIRYWTELQGKGMCQILDKISPATAPHKPYTAFRYANPLTGETLKRMKEDGVQRAVAFTQYPQHSCTTTGSSLIELQRQLVNLGMADTFHWSIIDRWATNQGLVEAFANNIKKTLEEYPAEERDKALILFTAHSLPLNIVSRGDSYPEEVGTTVQHVMEKLHYSNPYKLVWQSKVGPRQWLAPQTDATLKAYGAQGLKNIVLVPVAFTSDHIETLYELDLDYGPRAKKNWGVTGLKRIESMNNNPKFIAALANIVADHLASGQKCSKQYTIGCPLCTNPKCVTAREYFVK